MPLGITAHYESTVVPYIPAQMEKEVGHGEQLFQKIETNPSLTKNVIFSDFFMASFPKWMIKSPGLCIEDTKCN